ncbi:MAG TPA: hypothetical protein VL990_02395 [Acidobacteriaceae bacterium]|nr:hypothetical protein [Acidobacteriaceae bacterium]
MAKYWATELSAGETRGIGACVRCSDVADEALEWWHPSFQPGRRALPWHLLLGACGDVARTWCCRGGDDAEGAGVGVALA